jgi:hypothetical protein
MNIDKDKAEKPQRHFTHGTSATTADSAPEGAIRPEDRHVDAPATREAEPLPVHAKHDQLADKEAAAEDRQEALLDEGLEETFPGSDPVSVKRIT